MRWGSRTSEAEVLQGSDRDVYIDECQVTSSIQDEFVAGSQGDNVSWSAMSNRAFTGSGTPSTGFREVPSICTG
jgi:hypothetical protein